MESLNTAWQAASQDIYNAQQASGASGQPDGEEPQDAPQGKRDDGEVTDVDFEEVK